MVISFRLIARTATKAAVATRAIGTALAVAAALVSVAPEALAKPARAPAGNVPSVADTLAKPAQPPAGGVPTVVAFSGWVPPGDTVRGSSVERLVERLRASGWTAEIHDPATWPSVTGGLIEKRVPGPIILVGYSMGAGASTSTAAWLARAGIPVRKIVIVEAWNPDPVPTNVAEVVHYYVSGWATMLRPSPGFEGSIQNVDVRSLVPGIENEGHVSMSHVQAVQDVVVDAITGPDASTPPPRARAAGRGRPGG
ncbi:pimeloyl-ACP methyl ester carboxylesterase [Methylobacterium sp. BE186]|uniref:hypothetical protein n=1 Tax=Methylobacterium sp. BE186 TaxID=2817715 RepID=UPI00285E4E73|nr:hypothetical protein [Methylobacterium sp. BE186]MDR7036067.1 pimeloyl-ACP methyl ester carboxylesterase [Methylobacterium sp. BE186]